VSGTSARYAIAPIADARVSGSSRASVPAQGRQTSAPTVQASHVIVNGELRERSGFCATTLIA